MKIKAICLAGGEGKRMKTSLPKTLHSICGRTMLEWAIEAVRVLDENPTIVVGHGREQIMEAMPGMDFAIQSVQKGTGHAVQCARDHIGPEHTHVLITCGDMPLLRTESLLKAREMAEQGADAVMLSAIVENPTGYGRVVRDEHDHVKCIVEQRDADAATLSIREVNTSVFLFRRESLLNALETLKDDNSQGELYLTDTIAHIISVGGRVESVAIPEEESLGINDRAQLAEAARVMRKRINKALMDSGVELVDPDNTYIDWNVQIGSDTLVYPGNVLQSGTVIGANCVLYPGSRMEGARIGDGVQIQSSVILHAAVGDHTTVGPFAYLRPDSIVGSHVRIGDFVEIKSSSIGDHTKVSHLTYVGDSDVGRDVNIGCGVVFSNYDGKKKYRCKVGDHAFIGCNTNLVAPVKLGNDAYTAAGSTITEDVPDGALAIARSRQVIKEDWVKKKRGADDQ